MGPIELQVGPLVCAFCMVWGQTQPRPLCPDHAKTVAKALDDNPGYDLHYDIKTNKFFLLPRNSPMLPAAGGSKDNSMEKIKGGDLDPDGKWFTEHYAPSVAKPGALTTKEILRALKVRGREQDQRIEMLRLMKEQGD